MKVRASNFRVCTEPGQVEKGETVIYHVGNLALDRNALHCGANKERRETAKMIDWIAYEFLRRAGTWTGGNEPEKGTGEFLLFQERLTSYRYRYMAKRIKARGVFSGK